MEAELQLASLPTFDDPAFEIPAGPREMPSEPRLVPSRPCSGGDPSRSMRRALRSGNGFSGRWGNDPYALATVTR